MLALSESCVVTMERTPEMTIEEDESTAVIAKVVMLEINTTAVPLLETPWKVMEDIGGWSSMFAGCSTAAFMLPAASKARKAKRCRPAGSEKVPCTILNWLVVSTARSVSTIGLASTAEIESWLPGLKYPDATSPLSVVSRTVGGVLSAVKITSRTIGSNVPDPVTVKRARYGPSAIGVLEASTPFQTTDFRPLDCTSF